jgi:Lhr-like helicase
MTQAAVVEKSDDQVNPAMSVYVMYVPQGDRAPFEARALKLGAAISFDASEKTYKLPDVVATSIHIEDLVKPYAEGSRGFDRWMKEIGRDGAADARVVETVSSGVAARVATGSEISAARAATEMLPNATQADRVDPKLAYAAREVAARELGLNFVAKFIRNGFMLASPTREESYIPQMQLLAAAKPDEMREVAARTSKASEVLSSAEWRLRFDYAVTNNPEWKAKYAKAMREPDRGQAVYALNSGSSGSTR